MEQALFFFISPFLSSFLPFFLSFFVSHFLSPRRFNRTSERKQVIVPALDIIPYVGTNWQVVGLLVSLNNEVTEISLKTQHGIYSTQQLARYYY